MKKFAITTILTALFLLGCSATVLMGQQAELSPEEEWNSLTLGQQNTLRQRYKAFRELELEQQEEIRKRQRKLKDMDSTDRERILKN